MTAYISSTTDLPPPVLKGGLPHVNPGDNVYFTVGPWDGFSEGDTVQVQLSYLSQVLGETLVAAGQSLLGGSAKVDTVDVPVLFANLKLRISRNKSIIVKARWVSKNGKEFGDKVSAESTVQIREDDPHSASFPPQS